MTGSSRLASRRDLPPDLSAQAEALCPRDRSRYERIAGFLRARRNFFARAGAIVESWRYGAGRKLGPYARLAFRHQGRQQSLYLGRSQPLRKAVEALLAFVQKPVSQSRWVHRAIRAARAALHRSKRGLDRKLRAWGLWLKGIEVRGWRHLEAPINRSFLVAINVPRTHPSLRCPYLPPPGPPPLEPIPELPGKGSAAGESGSAQRFWDRLLKRKRRRKQAALSLASGWKQSPSGQASANVRDADDYHALFDVLQSLLKVLDARGT